jgi:hypothetical protein
MYFMLYNYTSAPKGGAVLKVELLAHIPISNAGMGYITQREVIR